LPGLSAARLATGRVRLWSEDVPQRPLWPPSAAHGLLDMKGVAILRIERVLRRGTNRPVVRRGSLIAFERRAARETMKSRLRYTGIRVKDLEASVKFYTSVLGMTERARNAIGETKGVVVDLISEDGGHPLELNYYEKGSPFDTTYEVGEGLDHLAFQVPNLDEAIAEAEKAGHPVVQEVKTAENRWVYVRDPNGIWIELFV